MSIEELDALYTNITPFPNKWMEEKLKTPKEELLKMLNFKTGGFRGQMREGFNGINDVTINIMATQLAKFADNVVIGYDHRHNSERFAYIFSKVFQVHKKQVQVIKLCVTPYLAMESARFNLGIMVTASHNSKEYNGVKLYMDGAQILADKASEIKEGLIDYNFTEIYSRNKSLNSYEFIDKDWQKDLNRLTIPIDYSRYFKQFDFDFPKVKNKIIPIFSALNGVSAHFIEEACKYFNMNINTSSKYNKIDPDFSGIDFPNPELEENWKLLYREMIPQQIDQNHFLFTNDPDGDRFGMAHVKNGELIIYNPNTIARIFLWYFLKKYSPDDLILVNTFLCDDFFETISKKYNIKYKKTETGFKHVIKGVKELMGTEKSSNEKIYKNFPKKALAYEDPLGYLIGTMKEKDGIIPAVLMYHILQEYDISEILADLASYGVFNSYTVQLRLEDPASILNRVISQIKYEQIHDAYMTEEDGFKIFLRISGTESMIKIYTFSRIKNDETLRNDVDWWILKNIICYCRE